jgi:flagellar hook-basal body complex protein FliE
MSIPTLTVSPSEAAQAYSKIALGDGVQAGNGGDSGFGAALGRALDGVVQAGHTADREALHAINGGGNFTEVATAVSHAELALQSAVAIRDKVVQAYQDVMRMPI